MTRLIPLLALLLVACAGAAQASEPTMAYTATLQPANTATPTPPATPTIDPVILEERRVALEELQARTNADLAEAERLKAEALAEQARRERVDAEATAQAGAGMLEIAHRQAEREAYLAQLALIQAQAEREAEAARILTERWMSAGWLSLAFAGLLAASVLGWRFVGALQERTALLADEQAESEPAEDAPGELYYSHGKGVRIPSSVATREQVQRMVADLAAGVPFTHDNFSRSRDADNEFAETQFTRLQELLTSAGIMEWHDAENHRQGCEITQRGRAWARGLAPSPTAGTGQNTTTSPRYDTNLPGGGGA